MQTVWKQDPHVRKADGNKLDTYANFMQSRSFDNNNNNNKVKLCTNRCY
jgi:hypothetical protein